ncbi:MAG: DUF4105 domain-containing protein [Bacteroidales bacterium]|nr:DUF4105 domain-containing protein [Bacteroidales bacterium]
MRRIVLIFALLLLPFAGQAQEQGQRPLSDSAFASVLTCGAGDEFYTSFGHTAIRVCDTARGLDMVYNYGTFDFDTPHFYWTFARGKLNYCLSRSSFEDFMLEYRYEGRAVWEQRLRLSEQEVNNLYLMLETNYLPEYRYYMYDFFRDNCATRVRDMVRDCLCHDRLSPECRRDTNLSYRNILYQSTEGTLLWWRLAIDMALGVRCDQRCSNYEYMFSPLKMMEQFDTLTRVGSGEPVAEHAVTLLQETRQQPSRSLSPTLVFWVLFVVVLCLTLMEWRKGWSLGWMDRVLFIVVSLLSLLALFLWFCTDHYCTKINLNVLWASPLFIYFAIMLRRSNRWVVVAQLVMLLAAMVMTLAPLPQQLNAALLPISLLLAVRLIAQLKVKNQD